MSSVADDGEDEDAVAARLRAMASTREDGGASDDLEAARWRSSVAERLFGAPAPALHIGRYRVLERIGGGARGVVWSAIDPELDRKVAIKVLHAREGLQAARAEMVREAKSLARLSHPNVVPVYDAGEHDGRVFVTLEHVDGTTLRRWLEQSHTRAEIVAVFEQAGRGLQAAHAAGIVHGDFKPENVLIGDDGRVRVSDFGIARATDDTEALHGIAGTPAYMAPEQFLGDALDGRADQFSFCVALHEALYRERPFAGSDRASLAANVSAGRRRVPSSVRDVPRWLERLLARGLCVDRTQRFPDMTALLRELARSHARRPWWIVAALAGAGATAAVLAATAGPRELERCRSGEAELDAAWNPTREQALRDAFAATRLPYAEQRADRLVAELDGFARSWREVHGRACAEDEGDSVALGRLYCLHTRLLELDSLVEVMASADPQIVTYATQSGRAPRSPAECFYAGAVQASSVPTLEPAAVDELRTTIARARAMGDAGRLDDGLALARQAVEQAQDLSDRSLEAEALVVAGEIERVLLGIVRDLDPSATMHAAVLAAEVAHRPDLVAQAAVGALEVVLTRGDYERAHALEQRSRAAVAAIGDPPELVGRIDLAIGEVAILRREPAQSIELLERARSQFEAAGPGSARWLAQTDNMLGETIFQQGRYVEARPYYERALALATETLGASHQLVANGNGNLAETYFVTGDFDNAERYFAAALAIRRELFGDTSVWAIHSFAHLGDVALERGDAEAALVHYRKGLAERLALRPGLERSNDGGAVVLSVFRDLQSWSQETWLRNGIAAASMRLGRLDEALAQTELTPDAPLPEDRHHPDLCGRIDMRAQVLLEMGLASEAIDHFDRAIARLEATYPADTRVLAFPLAGLGRARLARGDARGAIDPLERALAILAATPAAYPFVQQQTRDALAHARRSL